MIVSCERCGARYKLDDSKVTERGAKITCPRCRHIFVVYPGNKPAEKPSPVVIGGGDDNSAADSAGAPPKKISAENLNFRDVGIASWKVRVKIGLIYDFGDIKTLRKYLAEGRVTSEDVISHDAKTWKPIGEIPDLDAYFVEVYEEAKRIRDERSKSMFDDEDPTHIVGMGSIGSNLAAQALRTVADDTGPAPNVRDGKASLVSDSASADDLAAIMAAALDAEGGGGGGGSNNNPSTGPQFADPFAAMRNQQQKRASSRRTPSRPATARTGRVTTRQVSSSPSSSGGALKGLLVAAVVLLLLGGGGFYYYTNFIAPADASPTNNRPQRQAPANQPDLREQLEKELEEIEHIPLEDEEDAEPNFDEMKPVVPEEFRKGNNATPDPTPSGLELSDGDGGADAGVEMNADSPAANLQLGDQLFNQANYSGAVSAYSKAVGSMSSSQHGRYGIALFSVGDYNTAASELRQGMGTSNTVTLYLARTLAKVGDIAGASSYYQDYLSTSPSDAAAVQAELDALG